MPNERSYETLKGFPLKPSKIENIDTAMYSFLKGMNLHVETNNGSILLPMVWTTAERAFQAKSDSKIRDKSGALIFPIMTVERTSVTKDLSKKGSIQAALLPVRDERGGVIAVARRLKQDKSSNYANMESKKRRGQIIMLRKETLWF